MTTDAPTPSAPAPAPAPRSSRGRTAGTVVLLAALTALSALPTWIHASGTTALQGTVQVAISGSQVAPAIFAAAVALLAAAAAVSLVGPVGRWVVAVVIAPCGVLVVASALSVLSAPETAAAPVVAGVTGVGRLTGPVTTTAWPWVAVAVGVLDVLGALWFLRVSRQFANVSRRHESGPRTGGPGPDDERSAWDALSRGDDPS